MGMKLATEIPARRDGKLSIPDVSTGSVVYEFTRHPKDQALMVGDVKDDKTVAHLLSTGNFFPASEKDDARAEQLLNAMSPAEGEGEGEEEETDPNAPPVEGAAAGA